METSQFISSSKNSADCTSGEQKVEDFTKNTSWVSGPDFLYSSVECWPKIPVTNAKLTLDPVLQDSILLEYTILEWKAMLSSYARE